MSAKKSTTIKPFAKCPALDGYHCQTNSLAKIFRHKGNPLSEEMILGLGAGMGFIYWQMKIGQATGVFIGGRSNTKDFFGDLGERTGVRIKQVSTSSVKKARGSLLEKLRNREPVMVFADMGYLPWFDLPSDYHFGGHTFVVCGYDGGDQVLASDMDQMASGLKKGFYCSLSLEELGRARSSPFKPFPPKNAWLEFDFENCHQPEAADITSAIRQTVEAQLDPPIKNMGVKGLRHTAKMITRWPGVFDDRGLRMNLFMIYVFFEIGGTGGGCFRYMYSRFLKEAAGITGNRELGEASKMFRDCGKLFSEIGLMFREAETMTDPRKRIDDAASRFLALADLEERAYSFLAEQF